MARIRSQLPGAQALEPILLEIFKSIDKDIRLCNCTVGLVEGELDGWTIKEVVFNSTSRQLYGVASLYFKNGDSATIATRCSDYYPTLPTAADVIKCTLNYTKQAINFLTPQIPLEPGSLLETMIFVNDMEGAEIIGNVYGAEIGAYWIDYILDQQFRSKDEVNGELVAWLLEFKKNYFGFDGSQDLPVLL